jgi:hypothetical protein
MRHYSPVALEQAAGHPRRAAPKLATEEDLKASMRAQLGLGAGAKAVLAGRLGINEASLSKILRGAPVADGVAERLGFRKVVRYERIP